MPKDRLNDWSRTAANNSDIGGIGILGSNSPRNLDDAFREIMAQVADWRVNTSLDDTASFNNEDDDTKTFRFTGENIPTATEREIDAEALYDLATDATDILSLLENPMRGSLSGLTLSNGTGDPTNDIDISAGMATDSTSAEMMILASALTKRLDATWSVGDGNGGRDGGSIGNNVYHVHLIKRLDTGVVDALFSLSATSPTLPTNYTVFRRIGSIIRSGGAILTFSQFGDEFLLDAPVLDVDVSDQGLAAVLRTLTVPTGVKVRASFRARGNCASAYAIIFSSPDVASAAPTPGAAAPLADLTQSSAIASGGTFTVRTNTSGEIRTRSNQASTTVAIATLGWFDTRGK